MTTKESNAAAKAATADSQKAGPPICGLIMPISATEKHDEKHWASVQILLHRGIEAAGMTPANVWEGLNDRISKRIVSNIFRQDIVVADISDLNPNVMLELGLRLASKKPTVIVFNRGGRIPFDIGDVEAIAYPADLNILEMEAFFEKFGDALSGKLKSYKENTYEPYLGDVVVEVLEPQTKEVGIGELVLERLDEVSSRLARLEKTRTQSRGWAPRDLTTARSPSRTVLKFEVPGRVQNEVEKIIEQNSRSYSMSIGSDALEYEVNLRGNPPPEIIESIGLRIQELGGVWIETRFE